MTAGPLVESASSGQVVLRGLSDLERSLKGPLGKSEGDPAHTSCEEPRGLVVWLEEWILKECCSRIIDLSGRTVTVELEDLRTLPRVGVSTERSSVARMGT